jgi:hypothetical protein
VLITRYEHIWVEGVDVMVDHAKAVVNEPILQFFAYKHLRDDLQGVSKPFGEMADWIVKTLPRNPERTVALRKLLEAKDAAVRAAIYKG